MRYNIVEIRELRLEGKSLKEIGEYYGVDKSTISKFLKRNGLKFSQLPIKCKWCGVEFTPKGKEKYCSEKHRKYAKSERANKYFAKKRRKDIYLNRDNPNVYYHDFLNKMNDIKTIAERTGCECGSHDFIIKNDAVFCKVCGLEFINSTND